MPGYKDFQKAEVLDASDVNDYLVLQSVMIFETEADRNTQLAGKLRPGLISYVRASNNLEVYAGASWSLVSTYDDLPGLAAENDIKISLFMTESDPVVIPYEQDILFYSIFNNFADNTWPHKIWQ